MRDKRGFLLRVTVSLAALAGLCYALRGKLLEGLLILKGGLLWPWFLLSLGVYLVALCLISRRLQLILRVQGVKVSFPQTLYLCFIGMFFTLFFPSAFGGDVAKGYYAYQYSGKKLGSTTGILLDRILGSFTMALIAAVALLGYSSTLNNPAVERSVYGGAALVVFAAFFFSSRRFAQKFQFLSVLIPSAKWREALGNLYLAIREYRNHKRTMLVCLGLSVAAQFLFFSHAYLLARSLGISVSLWPFFVLMPLVGFISMAPSISGVGVREAGFVFFFKGFMPVEQALALSLLYDVVFYGASVAAGAVFAFKGKLKKEVIHDLEVAQELQEVGHDR